MSDTFTTRYRLAPLVQTWPFDVTGEGPHYLVEVTSRKFEVTAGVHRVIELLREGSFSTAEMVDRLHREGSGTATPEKVDWLLSSVLLPRGIVQPEEGEDLVGTEAPAGQPKQSGYLWAKVPLFGPETIRPLTRAFGVFFTPWVALPVLLLAAGAFTAFYGVVLRGFHWSLTSLSAGEALLLLLLLNLTMVFHELGHASACHHFGISHGKIGWGIYLFMFVLYADVSEAWRLSRRQRAVVDGGGMYFETIATLVLFALYLATEQPFFVYAMLLVHFSMLNSLNPFLRQDGYWIVADLAGEAHLRDANLAALRYGVRRLCGRRDEPKPALFRKPKWLQATIFLYSAVSVVFSVILISWLGRRLLVESIPAALAAFGELRAWAGGAGTGFGDVLAAAGRLAVQGIFLALVGFAAWSFLVSLLRAVFGRPQEGAGARAEWRPAL